MLKCLGCDLFLKSGSQKVYKDLDIDLLANISAFKYKELSVSAKIFISVHPYFILFLSSQNIFRLIMQS